MKLTLRLLLLPILFSFASSGQAAKQFYDSGYDKAAKQDFAGSISDFSSAISLNPAFAEAYYNRGTSKVYLKDFKGAITDFDKAIELHPDYISALKNRGAAKLKTDDTKGAVLDFDQVIRLDPANASAYFMRGQLRFNGGDQTNGCKDLAKANELGDTRAGKLIKQYCGAMDNAPAAGENKELLKLDWSGAEGWKVASDQSDKDRKVVELLKNNETFENWTEIGTMMEYPSLHHVPVDTAMNAMYEQAKANCASAKLTVIDKDENAAFPWILFKIECDNQNPESQVWQIIQGTRAMYVNFRAVKQNAIPGTLEKQWISFFKTASIVSLPR